MSDIKKVLITGFALFSLFFGAGNLILPPFLGFTSNSEWPWVTLGFIVTAVVIPICGILAHARVQGTIYDLGKKVSPLFSYIYVFLIYIIAVGIPSPRTASVTHEMAVQPYSDINNLVTSTIYFVLVFVFVLYRSRILDFIGKFLTPLIILILAIIVITGLLSDTNEMSSSANTVFDLLVNGTLEGYQTFDAIGGVVAGAVIVISVNLIDNSSYQEKRKLITKAGVIAGLGLGLIYAGLIFIGALYASNFEADATRTEVLQRISSLTLGNTGNKFLSVLVALACFTTAVGIVAGASDYFKKFFGESQKAYVITAVISCIIGIVVGSFNVEFIIDFAVPTLMLIYPITIILIFLNLLPEKYYSASVFRVVVITTILFSIPDFLKSVGFGENINSILKVIPFGNKGLGWVVPSALALIVMIFYKSFSNQRS